MSTIKLTKTENIALSEKPIMIVNDKNQRGYKTAHGFVPFGGFFISVYNQLLSDLDEIKKDMEENPGGSYGIPDYFQHLNTQDIIGYIEDGVLTPSMKETIGNASATLPFRVGFYGDQPVLYYTGLEEDLVIYDLLMVKENNVKIKFCKDCGTAFTPKTKGVYCPHCQDMSVRNKKKYQALTGDEVRLKYTRLQQRIQKREGTSQYRMLFERLVQENKNMDWLTRWESLDQEYKKLKRYSCEYGSQMSDIALEEQLRQSRIESIEAFEEWLRAVKRGLTI